MGSEVNSPKVSYDIVSAGGIPEPEAHRILVVSQMAGGSASAGVLIPDVPIGAEDALFDPDSMAASMVRAIRRENVLSPIDVIPLADAGGATAQVRTPTLVGTATAVGKATLIIGDEVFNSYTHTYAVGDTADDIGAALTALAQADIHCPAVVSNTSGALTVTFINGGTLATEYPVEISVSNGTGFAVTFGAVVAGATDPTLTGILTQVGDARYGSIVWPYEDTTEVHDFLALRWNRDGFVLDGICINGKVDAYADHITRLSGANFNSQNVVAICDEEVADASANYTYVGGAVAQAMPIVLSYVAALRALRLTDGASISHIVTTSADLDQVGGPGIAGLPYQNTPMRYTPPPRLARGWTQTEIDGLNDAGGSIVGKDASGTIARLGQLRTTYLTDGDGFADKSWKFLNNVDVMSKIRQEFHDQTKDAFSQARLSEGPTIRGRSDQNQATIEAFVDGVYEQLSQPEFALVEGGKAAFDQWKRTRQVTIDKAEGSVQIFAIPVIKTAIRSVTGELRVSVSLAAA